jgi:uncharacterized membrane protein YeaQ/YmgE (transglycosylase-associated protein family)
MEIWGWIILISGAVLIGLALQFVPKARTMFDWLIAGVAAFVGGYISSELLGDFSTWGPQVQGLYLAPALIGAVILAVAVDSLERVVYPAPTVQ